jgi:uncharacterized lipoprotein YmbA
MPTFIPPTDNLVRWADPFDQSIEHRLFRFLSPGARGRNVYKLTDDTFTENQPSDMSTVAKLYHGGHTHTVTAAEASALTDAGYGAYLS